MKCKRICGMPKIKLNIYELQPAHKQHTLLTRTFNVLTKELVHLLWLPLTYFHRTKEKQKSTPTTKHFICTLVYAKRFACISKTKQTKMNAKKKKNSTLWRRAMELRMKTREQRRKIMKNNIRNEKGKSIELKET